MTIKKLSPILESKEFSTILDKTPSATVNGERKNYNLTATESIIISNNNVREELERIVAVIPKELKEEIKSYIKLHKGCNEKIVILKALKIMGFNVKQEWLIDKRSTR